VPVTREVYGKSPTKTYKYALVGLSIDVEKQSVMPQEQIGHILESADKIGLAHCPCPTTAKVLGRADCNHSLEECVGCGACAEICPVNAVAMDANETPMVDKDWCIGCGVCMVSCPADVISMKRRHDEPGPANSACPVKSL